MNRTGKLKRKTLCSYVRINNIEMKIAKITNDFITYSYSIVYLPKFSIVPLYYYVVILTYILLNSTCLKIYLYCVKWK